eukprot:scaffold177631_cov31-Tisochrysis_lutea.AAC.1
MERRNVGLHGLGERIHCSSSLCKTRRGRGVPRRAAAPAHKKRGTEDSLVGRPRGRGGGGAGRGQSIQVY